MRYEERSLLARRDDSPVLYSAGDHQEPLSEGNVINLYTTTGQRLSARSIGEILGLGFLVANILLVLIREILGWDGGLAGGLRNEVSIGRGWVSALIAAAFLGLWFVSSCAIGSLVYRMACPSLRRSASGQSDAGEDSD